MSAIVTKFISSAFLSIMGLIVVRKMNNCNTKINTIRGIVLMLCLIILPAVIHNIQYTYLYSIIVYVITIITYKYILNISFPKIIISCALLMLSVSLLDSLISWIVVVFVSFKQARESIYVCLFSSIIISIIMLSLINFKIIRTKISHFISKIENKRATHFIIFFVLIVIAICILLYVISKNFKLNGTFTTSFLILIIFYLLVIILIIEKDNYDKLFTKYDNLFNYVKVFEDWIENEQLTRHEYKNQLAVLRCMTHEKEVKDKIDSIISSNINIDEQMVSQLKYLPSGGFKGLLYYKIAVARNNKVNIDVDIGSDVSKRLKKFNKEQLEILSKLIGIYCDNAIEAAKETRKKIVLLEIYEYNKIVHIVISNTFNKKKDISRRYEKGVSTKGEGRGNGLYFANKLISKNKWLEEKQDIVDNFYIQKISVMKLNESVNKIV